MKKVSLRVRKCYFDMIVAGEKTVEYRVDSPFWRTRLWNNPEVAVFLCGPRVHRRKIIGWALVKRPEGFSEQGQKDVPTPYCYAIYLGEDVPNMSESTVRGGEKGDIGGRVEATLG